MWNRKGERRKNRNIKSFGEGKLLHKTLEPIFSLSLALPLSLSISLCLYFDLYLICSFCRHRLVPMPFPSSRFSLPFSISIFTQKTSPHTHTHAHTSYAHICAYAHLSAQCSVRRMRCICTFHTTQKEPKNILLCLIIIHFHYNNTLSSSES